MPSKVNRVKKVILKNSLSPGDIVMLTAAVRDLHLCYPKQFSTDVRTPFPQLWENNPYLTSHKDDELGVETIECHYPLINHSNGAPYHMIHGFIEFLNQRLGLRIRPTVFRGDIHLTAREKSWYSQLHEFVGEDIPFWIVVAGGKPDVTIKWWDADRYQEVIDHFQGRIQFVQVGAADHHHHPLKRVFDLRGKTSIRELVRLMYHAQGVLCPVTFHMHLAAAVEVKPGSPKNRPCVVVAGGREPSQWEAYTHHQFLHTNGALFCCDNGGCWKARTVPLGDGDERDSPSNLCVDVVGKLPRCMDMITARDVVQRIELYFQGGALRFLTPEQARWSWRAVHIGNSIDWDKKKLEQHAFQEAAHVFLKNLPPAPEGFKGRGIVVCDRGDIEGARLLKHLRRLRKLGCKLPIEVWKLRTPQWEPELREQLTLLKAQFVEVEASAPGSERLVRPDTLKPYALLHSSFQEIVLLDEFVLGRNPEMFFEAGQYRRTGALFWPRRVSAGRSGIWEASGAPPRDEPEFNASPMIVNKSKCWLGLSLTLWYCVHSDFFQCRNQAEVFHAAFVKAGTPYAMSKTAARV